MNGAQANGHTTENGTAVAETAVKSEVSGQWSNGFFSAMGANRAVCFVNCRYRKINQRKTAQNHR